MSPSLGGSRRLPGSRQVPSWVAPDSAGRPGIVFQKGAPAHAGCRCLLFLCDDSLKPTPWIDRRRAPGRRAHRSSPMPWGGARAPGIPGGRADLRPIPRDLRQLRERKKRLLRGAPLLRLCWSPHPADPGLFAATFRCLRKPISMTRWHGGSLPSDPRSRPSWSRGPWESSGMPPRQRPGDGSLPQSWCRAPEGANPHASATTSLGQARSLPGCSLSEVPPGDTATCNGASTLPELEEGSMVPSALEDRRFPPPEGDHP